MDSWQNAGGASASDDRPIREHTVALLRTLAERGTLGSNADFLREFVRGLADAIAESNSDDGAQALERLAYQARSEVLGEVGHELLTPLNGILGYAQLLARDPTLNTSQLDAVSRIRECGERLHRLIAGRLDRVPGEPQPEAAAIVSEPDHAPLDPSEPPLPAALRSALLESAARGDIVEVNRGLDALEREARHPRLLATLRADARAFDMRAIRARLERAGGTGA